MTAVDYVDSLREHSRSLVRTLGFLEPRHRPSGLAFSKVHALIELGRTPGINAKELAAKLHLEKSSVSRLVQELVRTGLVELCASSTDGRSQALHLTELGDNRLGAIDDASNRQVAEALELLSPQERESVERGLRLYAKSLAQAESNLYIKIEPITSADDAPLEALIREALQEFGANREGFAFTDPELQTMHEAYSNEGWCYLIAKGQDGTLLGGGGIGPLAGGDKQTAELKKMYLAKSARGLGLGSRLVNALLQRARQMGYTHCYLETLKAMQAANGLYRKFGFAPLPKPMGKTGHGGCDAWYLLEL